MMRFLIHLALLVTAILGSSQVLADRNGAEKQVGLIVGADALNSRPAVEAFRQGMRDLGYVEGQNVHIVIRYAEGDPTRYPALAKELVTRGADVLVVNTASLRAATEATTTIPIVCPSF